MIPQPTLPLLTEAQANATPVIPSAQAALGEWLRQQERQHERWVASNGFTAKAGTFCLLPGADGALAMSTAHLPLVTNVAA